MTLITCKDLCINYDNFEAVSNASFTINKGEKICIVGENGSGKSTLLKAIAGLLKPKSGEIVFNDISLKNRIGYLPQQTQSQRDFPASVYEVVLSGCLNNKRLLPFYSYSDIKSANANIAKLGIKHIKNSCYRELSGGQQQRVLLARALCATDKLLLLDEPVTGLDPLVTLQMYSTIDNLNKNYGVTIVMVSHDVEFAVKFADRIVHINKSIEFFGSATDYKACDTGSRFLRGKTID